MQCKREKDSADTKTTKSKKGKKKTEEKQTRGKKKSGMGGPKQDGHENSAGFPSCHLHEAYPLRTRFFIGTVGVALELST